MTRRTAYLSALKFHFGEALVLEGKAPRLAYRIAKKRAAEYAFNVSTRSLTTVSIEVW